MSTGTRLQRAHELFDAALLRPPHERAAFLASACGDDAELLREVQSLLEHDSRAGNDFLRPPAGPPLQALAPDAASLPCEGEAPAGPVADLPVGPSEPEAQARALPANAAGSPLTSVTPDPLLGRRIGRYHVKSVIAAGGMATVYEAVQESPHRVVALKVMHPNVASRSALRRFVFESQTLARLRHRNIAQVYEAGVAQVEYDLDESADERKDSLSTDYADSRRFEAPLGSAARTLPPNQGVVQSSALPPSDPVLESVESAKSADEPSASSASAAVELPASAERRVRRVMVEVPYFAMEYIPGARPITEYAAAKQFSTRQRVELFIRVCDAVHHGHMRGVIHRDLKPANLLVDSAGEPKVIDFSVARATDSDLAITTQQTHIGQLVGTMQYMSPEQCDADPHDLDTRSDVYSLGVVLYELLTGVPPYDASRSTLYAAARTIKEAVPPRPSAVVQSSLRPRGGRGTGRAAVVQSSLSPRRGRGFRAAVVQSSALPPGDLAARASEPEALARDSLRLSPPSEPEAQARDSHDLGRPSEPEARARDSHDLGRPSEPEARARDSLGLGPRVQPARRHLARELRGNLDTIVLKALEKDRDRRYPSAADLAADLRAHLTGDPISAHPPTPWTRAMRWIGRHPVFATTALCVSIAALGIGGTLATIRYLWSWPYEIVPSPDGRRARLVSVAGHVIYDGWQTTRKNGIVLAELVPRPHQLGGGQVAVLAFGQTYDLPAECGALCVYELNNLRKPWWQGRVAEDELLPDPLNRSYTAGDFPVFFAHVADIFDDPTCPGDEIVAVFLAAAYTQCIYRIYDLTGRVRWQVWHDGQPRNCHWMSDERLLVFGAINGQVHWPERGHPEVDRRDHPQVVFAVRPELDAIHSGDGAWLRADRPGHLGLAWYKCLLPPDVMDRIDTWELLPGFGGHQPGCYVQVSVMVDKRLIAATWWFVDAHGNEARPGYRETTDGYKQNLKEHPPGDPARLPEPETFRLGDLPAMKPTTQLTTQPATAP